MIVVGPDAGERDSGTDTGGPDGGHSGTPDAGSDDVDSGTDTGGPDGGDSSGPDAGPIATTPLSGACTAATQCATGANPACRTELRLFESTNPPNLAPRAYRYAFEDGYCSTAPDCDVDADCGAGGVCFAPFVSVDAATRGDLELTLGIPSGSLAGWADRGVCLRGCVDAGDCLAGSTCAVPFEDTIALIPDVTTPARACLPVDSNPCLACSPYASCALSSSASSACTCAPGFVGDGITCVRPGVGEPCEADDECPALAGGAACLEGAYPLAPALPPGDFLARVGLTFEHGYCSAESNCANDAACGTGAACFAPFRQVTSETLAELAVVFDPPLAPNALDYLKEWSRCLRPCDDATECEADQICAIPADELVSQVPGSVNTRTYCVPDPE